MTGSAVDALQRRYLEATPASRAFAAAAAQVIPGGDTRASAHYLPYPVQFASGKGAWLRDLDGREHLDLVCNYTSLVHGNAYPPVVEAARAALEAGSAWASGNTAQVALAAGLVGRIPSVETVRFTNSGTEAAMTAMHIAKVATGRPKVLMARGGYHGSHEDTQAGTYAGTRSEPLFGGPDGQDSATLVADMGDAEEFEVVLAERGHEIAAVLLEPLQGSRWLAAPAPGFFQRVAAATAKAGAVFVLDEVITFRLGLGGAQEGLGIRPDLTLLGKLIGGGFPVGAVGGRADLMELTSVAGGTLQPTGTFNGNPVTMAAGAVAVEHLTAQAIRDMDERCARLEEGFVAAARDAGLPFVTRRAGSLLQFALQAEVPTGLRRKADPSTALLHLACHVIGLHVAPRGLAVLSTAHREAEVDVAVERFREAVALVAPAVA